MHTKTLKKQYPSSEYSDSFLVGYRSSSIFVNLHVLLYTIAAFRKGALN